MAPFSRLTIDVDGVASMASAAFSSLIEADVQVVADRTMTWGAGGYGSHAERGVLTRTATTWYLAEGATHGSFDLFYLIQNPGPAAAAVEIAYLRPAPLPPIIRPYTVGAEQPPDHPRRRRARPGRDRRLGGDPHDQRGADHRRAGDVLHAGRTRSTPAGHESAGVTAPQTRWFLAEGATGSFFNMFILIANPSTDAATVQMDYLLTNGQTVTRHAHGRRRQPPDAERRAGGAGARPRRTCRPSSRPPTACRSSSSARCGGRRRGVNWQEAHNSPGEIVTGTRWAMAEGESGGPHGKQTYILIANTSTFAGTARVMLLFEDGTTAEKLFALPASSRTNVSVDVEFPAGGRPALRRADRDAGRHAGPGRRRARDVRERQRHHLGRRHQRPRDQAAVAGWLPSRVEQAAGGAAPAPA